MTDKPETVADVLAEMRSQNLLSTHDWADRIERAREREAKASEEVCIVCEWSGDTARFVEAEIGGKSVSLPWRDRLDGLRELVITRAKASGSAPDDFSLHEQIDALAVDRYKVVPTKAGFWPFTVKAGDGEQELYKGHWNTCDAVAKRLTGAFLDGGFCAANLIRTEAKSNGPSAYCRDCQAVGMSNCSEFDKCSGATCMTCHRPFNAATPPPASVPDGLIDRIKAAEQRIRDGHSPRRIPADPTDVDLVLAEVRMFLETGKRPFWIKPTTPEESP